MQAVYNKTQFDLETVTKQEVPFLHTFYRNGKELNEDIRDLLAFQCSNTHGMPFYQIQQDKAVEVAEQLERYYAMMIDALGRAFEDPWLMHTFFNCDFLRKHGKQFIPYAKATFYLQQPAVYGRFDACYDAQGDELKGVYEFNGDTPVMLFESVNLQARMSQKIGTDQNNQRWEIFCRKFRNGYRNVAVACDTAYVEDMATCETIAQAFSEASPTRSVSFLDLKELDFDHANIHKPFVVKGTDRYLDAVYILSPWEEMVENFPEMLHHWERWVENVHLFEPAWRWFLAHKGMTALCWHLLSHDDDFWRDWSGVKILPTYTSWEEFHSEYPKSDSVEKPVIGRLSNNIRIHGKDGELKSDTGGYYPDAATIHQHYMAPGKVEGRNNFILGMWMCDDEAASLCFREFDEEVLSIANERWIPHVLVE